MRGDTIIALLIVAVAIGFIVRRAVLSTMRRARAKKASGPGCDDCGH